MCESSRYGHENVLVPLLITTGRLGLPVLPWRSCGSPARLQFGGSPGTRPLPEPVSEPGLRPGCVDVGTKGGQRQDGKGVAPGAFLGAGAGQGAKSRLFYALSLGPPLSNVAWRCRYGAAGPVRSGCPQAAPPRTRWASFLARSCRRDRAQRWKDSWSERVLPPGRVSRGRKGEHGPSDSSRAYPGRLGGRASKAPGQEWQTLKAARVLAIPRSGEHEDHTTAGGQTEGGGGPRAVPEQLPEL